jgi:hypothetical protein
MSELSEESVEIAPRPLLDAAIRLGTWIGIAAMGFGFASWVGIMLAGTGYAHWIERLLG